MVPSTATDVIRGDALWSIDQGDALAWLKSLPTRAAYLVFFSPPYEDSRTYGINFTRKGQDWVDWLRPIIVESARVSSGLVCVNMSCKVEDGKYTAAVEWLVADLTRQDGLVCGPSPYAWVKSEDFDDAPGNGTPGSGGNHYQRRDWEPIYTFALPDRIPGASRNRMFFSDNTAFGRPPKYGAGGAPSHRGKDGTRANDPWKTASRGGSGCGGRHANGEKKKGPKTYLGKGKCGDAVGTTTGGILGRKQIDPDTGEITHVPPVISNPGNVIATRHTKRQPTANAGDVMVDQFYTPPTISNPGNVLSSAIIASDTLRVPVGGGKLGCPIAHDGEAPMALGVAERFIRWFAPPFGIVVDPFAGTGTTGHAARKHNRRFMSCDLRDSQCELTRRRLAGVEPEPAAVA